MYAGQKASKDGTQYCLFPMDYLKANQLSGPDSYSHCCGHPVDWGFPYNPYPYYAPCDCTRIWTYPENGQSIYTSDAPVWTPSGKTYVSFLFAHDNSIPAQTHFYQGDLIGHSGDKWSGSGYILAHCHLDQSLVHNDVIVRYPYTCQLGTYCYALGNSAQCYDVFYLGGSEQIIDTLGMHFQTIPSTPEPEPWEPPVVPPGGEGDLTAGGLLLLLKYRNRRQKHGKRVTRL